MLGVLALYLTFVVFDLYFLYQCFEILWNTAEVPHEINILLQLSPLYLALINLLLEIRARHIRQANQELFREVFGIHLD